MHQRSWHKIQRRRKSEGGPRRRNFVSLQGKQKFLFFACPVAIRRLCYGARPSENCQNSASGFSRKKGSDFIQDRQPCIRDKCDLPHAKSEYATRAPTPLSGACPLTRPWRAFARGIVWKIRLIKLAVNPFMD